ncbi:MAG: hypothetical protein AB1505_18475 [Candidatus Latescibacterota bacterium]
MDISPYARLYGALRRTAWPGGRRIARQLRELEETQWFGVEELEARQLRRLQRLVVTALNEVSVPFIRYETGDLGVLRQEACPCGRNLPLLERIVGRQRDVTVTADGAYVYGAFYAQLFEDAPDVERYQVYQADRGHLEVRLQCRRAPRATWLEGIRACLQAQFGEAMQIAITQVDQLPPGPSGKQRFVISEVEPEPLPRHRAGT